MGSKLTTLFYKPVLKIHPMLKVDDAHSLVFAKLDKHVASAHQTVYTMIQRSNVVYPLLVSRLYQCRSAAKTKLHCPSSQAGTTLSLTANLGHSPRLS
jgi:hypothetical protein